MPDQIEAETAGWWLPVACRWRCVACQGEMLRVGQFIGSAGSGFVDRLPADSIGSLRKPTALTIVAPYVRP